MYRLPYTNYPVNVFINKYENNIPVLHEWRQDKTFSFSVKILTNLAKEQPLCWRLPGADPGFWFTGRALTGILNKVSAVVSKVWRAKRARRNNEMSRAKQKGRSCDVIEK